MSPVSCNMYAVQSQRKRSFECERTTEFLNATTLSMSENSKLKCDDRCLSDYSTIVHTTYDVWNEHISSLIPLLSFLVKFIFVLLSILFLLLFVHFEKFRATKWFILAMVSWKLESCQVSTSRIISNEARFTLRRHPTYIYMIWSISVAYIFYRWQSVRQTTMVVLTDPCDISWYIRSYQILVSQIPHMHFASTLAIVLSHVKFYLRIPQYRVIDRSIHKSWWLQTQRYERKRRRWWRRWWWQWRQWRFWASSFIFIQ